MSEPSSSDESDDSSDGEGGLFGGAMKSMFKESDMKKEFVHTYVLPNLSVGDGKYCKGGNEELRPHENSNAYPSGTEVTVKLVGIHESFGQTAEKTGYTLWGAAIKLANNMVVPKSKGGLYEYFARDGKKPTKVLELGAGLGLCGILASKLDVGRGKPGLDSEGKKPKIQVVVTDGDSKVLDGIRDNIELNFNDTNSRNIIPMKLRWGNQYIDDFLSNIPDEYVNKVTTSAQKSDDETSNLTVIEKHQDRQPATFFDVIMGSDIIYDECVIPDLFDTGKCPMTWQ